MSRFREEIELNPPTEETQARLNEVKFWITFNRFYDYVKTATNPLGIQLIETLCAITNVRATTFNNLIQGFQVRSVKPSKLELILCFRYAGFSYQKIEREYGISKNTSQKYIKEYIKDGQPPLPPKIATMGFWEDLNRDIEPLLLWLSACNHANLLLEHKEKLHR